MPLKVYRVEHEDTYRGPYRNAGLGDKLSGYHTGDPIRPTPNKDDMPGLAPDGWFEDYHMLFGFKDPAAAYRWFAGWLEELHAEGFVLSEYVSNNETPDVRYAKSQLVYDPVDFDLVRHMSFGSKALVLA